MGKHIKLYVKRMENGYFQKDLARKLGLHQQTYHKKEVGKREFTITEGLKLCEIFDCKLDYLFGK